MDERMKFMEWYKTEFTWIGQWGPFCYGVPFNFGSFYGLKIFGIMIGYYHG